ncbi:feruloyl esterase like protein [Verticillium longisporum]|nr:feruloyl esterase like protein [Verticillium longisporum]
MILSQPLSSLLALAFLGVQPTVGHKLRPRQPSDACKSISIPELSGAEVLSVKSELRLDLTGSAWDAENQKLTTLGPLDFCEVNVTLTHPGANDEVTIWVWLPLKQWNGRFQGVGGGGLQAGRYSLDTLGLAVKDGYAAAATDGSAFGDGANNPDPALFLKPGVLDLERLTNFAHRALHEVAVVGKAVTAGFYDTANFYSYWTGCSTGGRQGYELAQRYPEDFDGILANAPALHWSSFVLALGWGRHAMRVTGHTPTFCAMQAFTASSIDACDALDGVQDGVISDPNACHFDPSSLVGEKVECMDETTQVITEEDVTIATMIREGPKSSRGRKLWDGHDWGINYLGLVPAAVSGIPEAMDRLVDSWIEYFIEKDVKFDVSTLTAIDDMTDLFAVAPGTYDSIIGSNNPDLSAFRDAGGKLISWHGTADQLIMINNTIRYREQVEAVMGGADLVDDFYKFYLAPGVGHCEGEAGATPRKVLDALVAWVEKAEDPGRLSGTMKNLDGEEAERIICPYPLVPRYDGVSDPNDARSFDCATSFRPNVTRCR